jgi:hypothetical protein
MRATRTGQAGLALGACADRTSEKGCGSHFRSENHDSEAGRTSMTGNARSMRRSRSFDNIASSLEACFPVVRRLCDDSFPALVNRYLTWARPRRAFDREHAKSFPGFIRCVVANACGDYLADMAELELARFHAGNAKRTAVPTRISFDRLQARPLQKMGVALHPSVVLVASRFPIVSLWEANQPGGDNLIYCWCPESALVARPQKQIEIWRLPCGGVAFLLALASGAPIEAAAAAGSTDAPAFDLAANLATLLRAGVVVSTVPPIPEAPARWGDRSCRRVPPYRSASRTPDGSSPHVENWR